MRDGPTDGHPAPGVHQREDSGRHLSAHVIEVTIHSLRSCLAQTLHHSNLLVVESFIKSNLLQPGALVVCPGEPDDSAAFNLEEGRDSFRMSYGMNYLIKGHRIILN